MYVRAYVCMHVCVCVICRCVCIHTCVTHTNTPTQTQTHTNTHTHTHTHTHVCVCVYCICHSRLGTSVCSLFEEGRKLIALRSWRRSIRMHACMHAKIQQRFDRGVPMQYNEFHHRVKQMAGH